MPLLYHSGALGDLLLSLPFLRALRRTRPDGPWTLATREEHATLIARVFPFTRRAVPGTLELAGLSRAEPDPEDLTALLDRHGAVYGFVRDADRREREIRRLRPDLPSCLLEPLAWSTQEGEEIEHSLAVALRRLDPALEAPSPADFSLPAAELPPAPEEEALPVELRSGRVAWIHTGASARSRMAPLPLLADLARWLEDRDWTIGWLRGPVEVERGLGRPTGLCVHAPGILALAHWLAGGGLFIGNDSGPTHLASALGLPTLALHGSPNPLWRPRGVRSRVVGGAGGFPGVSGVVEALADLLSLPRDES